MNSRLLTFSIDFCAEAERVGLGRHSDVARAVEGVGWWYATN